MKTQEDRMLVRRIIDELKEGDAGKMRIAEEYTRSIDRYSYIEEAKNYLRPLLRAAPPGSASNMTLNSTYASWRTTRTARATKTRAVGVCAL